MSSLQETFEYLPYGPAYESMEQLVIFIIKWVYLHSI